jgi:peptidoglycan/LPS O-acetylase OafA/YrhL
MQKIGSIQVLRAIVANVVVISHLAHTAVVERGRKVRKQSDRPNACCAALIRYYRWIWLPL